MLNTLKKLFEEGGAERHTHAEIRRLEVAVACLLHESKRVDLDEADAEHAAAREALTDLFSTSEAESESLLHQGRDKARHLTSYFAPVALIKRDWGLEHRVQLVEHLWKIAYADGKLERDEDHYVRKIAHLLYVPNTQCMLARSKAKN